MNELDGAQDLEHIQDFLSSPSCLTPHTLLPGSFLKAALVYLLTFIHTCCGPDGPKVTVANHLDQQTKYNFNIRKRQACSVLPIPSVLALQTKARCRAIHKDSTGTRRDIFPTPAAVLGANWPQGVIQVLPTAHLYWLNPSEAPSMAAVQKQHADRPVPSELAQKCIQK